MTSSTRYSRTTTISSLPLNSQDKISSANILLIGVGGLGSYILPHLVSSGVGKITIIENDNLELSNLQRQIIYKESDIGQPKAVLAQNFAHNLNSDVKIEIYNQLSTFPLLEELLLTNSYLAVVDATDSIKSRIISNKAAMKKQIPLFTGAIREFIGHVYSFKRNPCYSCIFGNESPPGPSQFGIFPPVVGMVGSKIASNILNYILFEEADIFDKFHIMNLKDNSFKSLKMQGNAACLICQIKQ